jgi:hypothetical protein
MLVCFYYFEFSALHYFLAPPVTLIKISYQLFSLHLVLQRRFKVHTVIAGQIVKNIQRTFLVRHSESYGPDGAMGPAVVRENQLGNLWVV